ncbi:hypothetical protein KRP22_004555 [Phytophthora ramorum]|nr:hypothetical protein KRP22_14279 [Phytophthora ramorum]
MARSSSDGASLWAAVGGLSDVELRGIQHSVRQFHCVDPARPLASYEARTSARSASVQLPLGRVRVDDFVPIFLDFVHGQTQLHANARVSEDHFAPEIGPTTKPEIEMDALQSFEHEFPQLKPVKRRITTTLLTTTSVARPVPATIAFPPLGSSESTRPPAWAKRSLLEKRMGGTNVWGQQVIKEGVMQVRPKKKIPVSQEKTSNQETHLRQETHIQQEKRETPSNQEEESPAKKTINVKKGASSSDFKVNRQAARLYGFLIRERFVSSTCAELQVLISLLYRANCTACSSNEEQPGSDGGSNCEAPSEFCWRDHCLDFAKIVFHEIEPVLTHLGSDLLKLVEHSLHDAEGICSSMLERLDQVSRQREELRVAESARVGCQLPVEMKASAVRDFALPFNEETDSRLHYRTPAESLLYTNREKVRDGFLSLLRQFQQKQHSLVGIENAGVAAAAIALARELLAEVFPENRWWFAKFFVQELLQVGSNPFGESDKELVLKIMEDKLVVKNPDRLRKLHRRFSNQKPLNKSPQPHLRTSSDNAGSNGSGNSNNRTGGKGNNNSPWKSRQDTRVTTNEDDATKKFTATLDRMKSFFTDNQLFFFHFLHSCDSYEFSELVKHQLERQFYAIRENTSPSADARNNFTELVLRLKVMAKFLGYLRFSPQWEVTSSIRQLSEQNAAFKAVEREGISTLEVARDSSLDVKKLLENSILQASISKCIPWLCDYLTMLSLDKLSSGTTYFKQLVVLLQLLYRSPRLNSLGETGLYIAMQIERIFHVMKLDAGFIHNGDYLSEELLPPSNVRLALTKEGGVSSEDGEGEDHLPFLYSQVFVQSCVSELEDLRGFIQTRAQPLPRRKLSTGTGRITKGQLVTPIRKLRPLQVVIQDDQNGGISSFTSKHDNDGYSATSGVKSPTTAFPGTLSPLQEENDKLSEAVFKVHPKLKAVVEFVVGNVTTDVCEHVMAQLVTPRADVLVDRCASESGLLSIGRTATQDEDAATAARASFQMLITSKTRQEVRSTVVAALQEALRLGEDRVTAAIPPFMPPSSHPTLTSSIVFVALQRTRGALRTLVPRSSQTEFVKRLAFRNKSLLKEAGWGPKTTVNALRSSSLLTTAATTAIVAPVTGAANQEETQLREEEQRYRSLKRCIATMSKHAGSESKIPSVAEWELQTTGLLQCLSEFTSSFSECVAAGDLSCTAASPLKMTGLVLWDIVWQATTFCLKVLGSSLDVFAVCELLSMKEERIETVEKVFTQFVAKFLAVLKVTVQSIGQSLSDDTAASRLRSMLAFVLAYVVELPSGRLAACADRDDLARRFAVPASSQIVAALRDVVSLGERSRDPSRLAPSPS